MSYGPLRNTYSTEVRTYSDVSGAARGQRNTRHDDGVDAWAAATREATGRAVLRPSRGDPRRPATVAAALQSAADLNEGYIPDMAQRGGAGNGSDWLGEHKCYHALQAHALAAGSRGGFEFSGATVHMGNTEEALTATVLGLRERGVSATVDGVFSHATGRGYVAPVRGQYHDALTAKHATVLLLISEVFGSVN